MKVIIVSLSLAVILASPASSDDNKAANNSKSIDNAILREHTRKQVNEMVDVNRMNAQTEAATRAEKAAEKAAKIAEKAVKAVEKAADQADSGIWTNPAGRVVANGEGNRGMVKSGKAQAAIPDEEANVQVDGDVMLPQPAPVPVVQPASTSQSPSNEWMSDLGVTPDEVVRYYRARPDLNWGNGDIKSAFTNVKTGELQLPSDWESALQKVPY